MRFAKPPISVDAQVNQLETRGLIVSDREYAKACLTHINYYRLAGYWWPFQSDKINHKFKPNSKFETVIRVYQFDSEFRKLVFNVIEEVEVAIRTRMIYHLSHEFDPWWFEMSSIFQDKKEYTASIHAISKELDRNRNKETFLKEHYVKYSTDLRMPPSWKTFEVVSFGTLSKLYGNLVNGCKSKDRIAQELGVANHTYLHSWLQSISQIRNVCAHHGRLWNKNLAGRPKLLSKPKFAWLKNPPPATEHHMIYVHLCCMKYLLNIVNPRNHFTYQLYVLLKKYPNIDLNALGMPTTWYKEKLWSNHVPMKTIGNTAYYKLKYIFWQYFKI